MNKKSTLLIALAFISGAFLPRLAGAQPPEKMSYQAVIRDADNSLVTNHAVGMRISILQGSTTGTVVYTETQTPASNANGLVSIEIGGGTGFNTIDWSNGPYYIKTETDPGGSTNYTITGTSQLLSVPYALHAKTAENMTGGFTEADPVFNASAAKGITAGDTANWNKKFAEKQSLADVIAIDSSANARIKNVSDPADAQDAATKAYVDALKESIYNELLYAGMNGVTKDIDGNAYKTVKIGNQIWMAENLKTTKYKDGTPIKNVLNMPLAGTGSPAFCLYEDELVNLDIYGALYTRSVLTTGKLCPIGWHVPGDAEWITLISYLGGDSVAGGKMKEAGTEHWMTPNTGADNSSGFTALPGGLAEQYASHGIGGFSGKERCGSWWSDSGLTSFYVHYDRTEVLVLSYPGNYGKSVRCIMNKKEPLPQTPVVETKEVSSILRYIAFSGGIINSDGGALITRRGICWDTNPNPDTSNNNLFDNCIGSADFTSSLTGLTLNTTYYIRAYAINEVGIGYGNELVFKTLTEIVYGSVTDVEGNVYKTIQIGPQTWMAENLKATKYNNSTAIPLVTDNTAWAALLTPGHCWYDNDETTYKNIYGALYNWYAVDTSILCPTGWHVPSDAEWTTLTTNVGGESAAGNRMKLNTGGIRCCSHLRRCASASTR